MSVLPPMIYERLLRPLLFRLGGGDAESAHETVLRQLEWLSNSPSLLRMTAGLASLNHKSLRRTLFGLRFPNPVGLAGGFDKNGVAVPALEALGFGFVEVGTVTRFPQPGNPKPRLFRYPEKLALINRMGFNNNGAEALAQRLKALRRRRDLRIPVGVSIGKSKVTPIEEAVDDYLFSLEELYRFADYFAVNVSSPNTPGLRALQERTELENLIAVLQEKSHHLAEDAGIPPRPLLLKISPDLTFDALDELLEVCVSREISGLIAVNTTIGRQGFSPDPPQDGGLSGKPLFTKALAVVEHVKKSAPELPLIGVGGITTPDDAVRMLDAGADLLQVYTGFVYGGPFFSKKLCGGIVRHSTDQIP